MFLWRNKPTYLQKIFVPANKLTSSQFPAYEKQQNPEIFKVIYIPVRHTVVSLQNSSRL